VNLAVSMPLRMQAGWGNHWIPRWSRFISSPEHPDHICDHPVSSPVSITVLSQHFKWPVSETDYWPASRIEVRNIWSFTSTHTFVFVVWCLVTRRDSITLWLPLHITSQNIQQINFLPATKQNVQFKAIIEHSFMLFYRVNVQQKITLIFGRGCFTHLKCIRKQNLQCLPVDMIASVSSGLNYQQTQH
jgi:hypothetical protein